MDRQIVQLLQEGTTTIPNLLLKRYKRLSLSDEEMMLLIHLLSFQQEGIRFPTLAQLEERLSMPGIRLIQLLQKLMKEEWLTIDEWVDAKTQVRFEQYNLEPLYQKLSVYLRHEFAGEETAAATHPDAYHQPESKREYAGSLYSQFEQAFGRPLSPIEIQTMQLWLEQDEYSDELIVTALREASSVGKLHIRYIDRILLEWQRNKIKTVEEARTYSLNFRRSPLVREYK